MPTGCTIIRLTGKPGGIQWEYIDEWPLRRAHALAWPVQSVQEIDKEEHRGEPRKPSCKKVVLFLSDFGGYAIYGLQTGHQGPLVVGMHHRQH